MEQPNTRAQSEYHMAFSYLNRLNWLFYICDESAMSLEAHAWFHSLMAIHRELSTEMKEEEQTFWNNKKKEINTMMALRQTTFSRSGRTEVTDELYNKLDSYELFLRKTLEESGLQKKMKEDPNLAFT